MLRDQNENLNLIPTAIINMQRHYTYKSIAYMDDICDTGAGCQA